MSADLCFQALSPDPSLQAWFETREELRRVRRQAKEGLFWKEIDWVSSSAEVMGVLAEDDEDLDPAFSCALPTHLSDGKFRGLASKALSGPSSLLGATFTNDASVGTPPEGLVGDDQFNSIADELRAKYSAPHMELIASQVQHQAARLFHIDFSGASVQDAFVVLREWVEDFSYLMRDTILPMREVERTRLVPLRCTYCHAWFNPEQEPFPSQIFTSCKCLVD